MFARLTSKAEQREKEKRACDQRPAKQLELRVHTGVILPNKACDLQDLGIVAVHDSPARPRHTHLRVGDDEKHPQRNGPEDLDGRNCHQAEVLATIGIGD